jgi:hypothetical protein
MILPFGLFPQLDNRRGIIIRYLSLLKKLYIIVFPIDLNSFLPLPKSLPQEGGTLKLSVSFLTPFSPGRRGQGDEVDN